MSQRKKKSGLWWKLLLGFVAVFAVLIYLNNSRNKDKGTKVYVHEVSTRNIIETVSASGKIYPETEVAISSDVSGEIVDLLVVEGDSVVKGQLLLRINADTYTSTVERLKSTVNASKAQASNAKSQIESARAQKQQLIAQKQQILAQIESTRSMHKRNEQLHKEGIISDSDFEASLSSLKSLQANMASLDANVASAEASIRSAQENAKAAQYNVESAQGAVKEANQSLKKTTIYAPASGIISALNIEKGERVVGTLQMAGTEIMRISNLNTMEVQVEVSENDVLNVSLGDTADVEVDAYVDETFLGVITEIANSANAASALSTDQVTNFTVKIRLLPASYKHLIKGKRKYAFRPGMSASVDVRTNIKNNIIAIPIQAITTRERDEDADTKKDDNIMEVVFATVQDSVAMIEVKTGIQDDEYIEVLSGLLKGVTIIEGPYNAVSKKLESGKKVNVVDKKDLNNRK